MTSVGICGLGFVGSAIEKSFRLKGVTNLIVYDKYKNGGIGNFDDLLYTDIIFLALPTIYDEELGAYDLSPINETLTKLQLLGYNNIIVNKSTVEPGTNKVFADEFGLKLVHNPEFLTAATAFEDFHNQKHIVLGATPYCSTDDMDKLNDFYQSLYPDAVISVCQSDESECMKSFVNCFYAAKIQFFNELYLTCQSINTDYDVVKNLMLKNGWINPMHTNVPGTDGQLSYGGLCFPKDTNALLQFMKRNNVSHKVLEAVITERNEMRSDHDNVKKTI
jgi:UDPglucose 6-dehydrogenase